MKIHWHKRAADQFIRWKTMFSVILASAFDKNSWMR